LFKLDINDNGVWNDTVNGIGEVLGDAVTNASGVATKSVTVPAKYGDGVLPIYVEFVSLDAYLGSYDSAHTLTVGRTVANFILEAEGEVTIDGGGSGNGIEITGGSNVYIQGSSENSSHFNIMNCEKGIKVVDSSSIIIRDCVMKDNDDGIYLTNGDNCTIFRNTITGSVNFGVILDSSSSNNIIGNNGSGNSLSVGNNIFDNATNAFNTGSGNTWKNNYYGDCPDYPNAGDNAGGYDGSDLNADGFGDSPYTFNTGSDAQPLMGPVETPTTKEVILQVSQ